MTFAADLAVHNTSRDLLTAYAAKPRHGLLIHGDIGVGLLTTARAIASEIAESPNSTMVIMPEDGKDISIADIRQLYYDTQSSRDSPQIIIIDDADRMSLPAQNAFLKLLEEPPRHVYFILTSHAPQALLATIESRVEAIELRRIGLEMSKQLIEAEKVSDPKKTQQLLFMASGRPAQLIRLIRSDEYFEVEAAVMRRARDIIEGSTYSRLIAVKDLATDREKARQVLAAMGEMLLSRLDDTSRLTATLRRIDTIADAIDAIQANGNARLHLMGVVLSL